MGAGLVTQALALPLDSHTARLVLIRIALTAKDTDPTPRYWDGWMPLAAALNRRPQLEGRWRDEADENAARRAVDRAVATLVRHGYIARLNVPRPGLQAEYILRLDDPREPALIDDDLWTTDHDAPR